MALGDTKQSQAPAAGSASRVEPALYVVLEGERPLAGGLRASLDRVEEVHIGRGLDRSFEYTSTGAELEIPDERMSRRHARLRRREEGFVLEDLDSKNGVFVAGQRVRSVLVTEPTVATLGATAILVDPREALAGPRLAVTESSSVRDRPPGLVSLVPAVEEEAPRVLRVARSNLSVLILGESGVGKEVVARAVHAASDRKGAFVAVNCGALGGLVESQLFGFVRGAFSGATADNPGLVRAAAGGTLFLDEIGDLPAAGQAALLRVLQQREVLPVGATRAIAVDLRVVSATLRPIQESPSFRPDLYARIAAFVHPLRPLRERRGDLGILVADLLPRVATNAADVRFAPDIVDALASHPWPLNVRELEHVLSVAMVTAGDERPIRLSHVGTALSARPGAAGAVPAHAEDAHALSDADTRLRDELVAALGRTQGNVSEVARQMNRTRMQIHRWMRRFGVDPGRYRSG